MKINYWLLNKLKNDLTHEQRLLNLQIKRKYKKLVVILTIIFILGLISNLGALMLTNAMVTKAEPNKEIIEMNPVTAQTHNLKTTPEATNKFKGVIIHLLAFCLFIGGYIYMINTLYTEKTFYLCFAFYSYISFIFIYDFVNDFGYYLGVLLA